MGVCLPFSGRKRRGTGEQDSKNNISFLLLILLTFPYSPQMEMVFDDGSMDLNFYQYSKKYKSFIENIASSVYNL